MTAAAAAAVIDKPKKTVAAAAPNFMSRRQIAPVVVVAPNFADEKTIEQSKNGPNSFNQIARVFATLFWARIEEQQKQTCCYFFGAPLSLSF